MPVASFLYVALPQGAQYNSDNKVCHALLAYKFPCFPYEKNIRKYEIICLLNNYLYIIKIICDKIQIIIDKIIFVEYIINKAKQIIYTSYGAVRFDDK